MRHMFPHCVECKDDSNCDGKICYEGECMTPELYACHGEIDHWLNSNICENKIENNKLKNIIKDLESRIEKLEIYTFFKS